jgi:hypothetical protein
MGADKNFSVTRIIPSPSTLPGTTGNAVLTVPLPAASGTIVSMPTNMSFLDTWSYEYVFTGATLPKGTIDIQVSNDHDQKGAWQNNAYVPPGGANALVGGVQDPSAVGNWTSLLTLSPGLMTPTAPAALGVLNNQTILVTGLVALPYRYIRTVYTSDGTAPGTGNLAVWFCGKSI